ncbi:unnamed protein product [Effrenium voratum]|uniref:Crinkler effector protein N-terminal domain-containing protein n=1 Tax=Effrenium voratum TaxID=2562239 RepID=A0AA36I7S0_9DINO|nr:unnamed protein product [Effrenium voratum]CAJ1417674.1 unnamed protein product [Effrenium voratum]
MRHAHRKPWFLFLLMVASDLCFIQTVRNRAHSSIALKSIGDSQDGRPALRPPFRFHTLASEAAIKEGLEVEQYLSNVLQRQDDFMKTNEVVDRGDFLESLRQAMRSTQFSLVLGGKNLGKTLMRKRTVCELENEPNANLTFMDVNMREQPSKELFKAILGRVASKRSDWAGILQKVASSIASLASAVAIGTNPEVVAPAAATPISAAVKVLVDSLTSNEREQTLLELIDTFHTEGNDTCILVDEANIALPAGEDPENIRNARQALQYFVMLTKEAKKTGVVLITSDFGYPFRLQNCGMNLQDIQRIINVNEVPKADMLQLMVDRWGMSEDLGKEFFSYFGGNIDICSAAVKELASKRSALDPLCIVDCPGLPACAADPDAKKHLQNMLEQGWSPVFDVELDAAAKFIAERNVGGIVAKRAKYFDQPENMWNGKHKYALVPSGTLMRWKIGEELARMESMGSIGKVASQPPPAVWVCQLGSPDGKDFEIVGNAFQVKGVLTNVDDLKEAIKQKKPNTVSCDADELDIYSRQDGRWVKEGKMSASLRDTDEADCYGFMLPAGAAGAA